MSLVGETIRNIRIIQPLGTGGMSQVYLGFDDNLHRQVAVKVLRGRRRLNEESRQRFKREAQTLSSLDHPNICRIFDLIAAEDSDCLILELVRGKPLSAVMGERLSHMDKLGVAQQIATALEAAHSKQIVHRDIKPDNIMITEDGVVKVLDFGIARQASCAVSKGMSGEATEVAGPSHGMQDSDTESTQEGVITGTPMFMSPEQARGKPLSTASDMYSVGLLMQQLFTGESPFDEDLAPVALVFKAMHGKTRPVQGLDVDLTRLIERLLNLAPELRPTAAEVVVRLQWMLDGPRRRIRRQLTLGFIALLIVGVVTSSAGFLQARQAQRRSQAAEQEARVAQQQAEAVQAFLSDMLTSVQPDEQGIDVKMIDVLSQASATLPERFPEHPAIRSAVLHTLGCSFRALGQYDAAFSQIREAYELRKELFGEEHVETLRSLDELATTERCMGDYEQAEQLHRHVVDARKARLGPEHPETLASLNNLAAAIHAQGRYQEAIDLLQEVLADSERVLGEDHPETLTTRNGLALLLAETGRFEEALLLQRKVLDSRERTSGPNHSNTLNVKHNMASSLKYLGRLDEAETLLRDVLDARKRLLGERHPDTLRTMNNLASLLRRAGSLAEAESLFRDTLRLRAEALGREHPKVIRTMINLASLLTSQKQYEDAETLNREALQLAREKLGDHHPDTLGAMNNLAAVLRYQGKLQESERLHRQVLDLMKSALGPEHPSTFVATRNLATVLREQGEIKEAEGVLRKLIDVQTEAQGRTNAQTAASVYSLAMLLWEDGRIQEASALYREAAAAGHAKASAALERLGIPGAEH